MLKQTVRRLIVCKNPEKLKFVQPLERNLMKKLADALKVGRRTQREMDFNQDNWNQVKLWATENGYKLCEEDGDKRILYKRSLGWTLPPTYLEMAVEEQRIVLDFWVKADAYLVVSLMTSRPPEIRLDRGGMTAMVPRKKARDLVNGLMDKLSMPLIP